MQKVNKYDQILQCYLSEQITDRDIYLLAEEDQVFKQWLKTKGFVF